jgi:hypothetical protein
MPPIRALYLEDFVYGTQIEKAWMLRFMLLNGLANINLMSFRSFIFNVARIDFYSYVWSFIPSPASILLARLLMSSQNLISLLIHISRLRSLRA